MNLKGIGRKKTYAITQKLPFKKNINITEKEFIELFTKTKEFALYKIEIEELRDCIDSAKKTFEDHAKNNINAVSYLENEFPKKLLEIKDPPVILFYKGNISKLNNINCIAVVGARKPSLNSYDVSYAYAKKIIESNLGIISGLAKGCDTAAHKGALDNKGFTAAVMPCALDDESVYPKENIDLFHAMLEKSNCIISEYGSGTKIQNHHFIERDRLQSGLSNSILIIETSLTGGTMHTYKFALEQTKLIGCCYFDDIERFDGNIEILKNSNVFKINDPNDLDNFIVQSKESKFKLF